MKSLFYGIGVATLAGLAIGGALRPSLALDRIGGPQIALADSGRRAYGDGEYQATGSSYPYGIPDYVIGTDHLQPVAYDTYAPEPAYEEAAWRDPAPEQPTYQLASYTAEPTPTYDSVVHYPSQGGGILAGLASDQPPADLGPEVFEPADAPPAALAEFERDTAASGDTSSAQPSS